MRGQLNQDRAPNGVCFAICFIFPLRKGTRDLPVEADYPTGAKEKAQYLVLVGFKHSVSCCATRRMVSLGGGW